MGLTVTDTSQVFVDDRGGGRALRVSWHPEHRMAVLSVWHGCECAATFRLPAADVAAFGYTLTNGLAQLATASTTARRDDTAATLLGTSTTDSAATGLSATARAAPVERPERRRWKRHVTRGIDALVAGATRLRDRLDRS